MKITLNIGLENNPLKERAVLELLADNYLQPIKYKVELSEYEGKPERTMIVITEAWTEAIDEVIEKLCEQMTQECIAYMDGSNGKLIYNDKFVGDKYDFDINYFLKF